MLRLRVRAAVYDAKGKGLFLYAITPLKIHEKRQYYSKIWNLEKKANVVADAFDRKEREPPFMSSTLVMTISFDLPNHNLVMLRLKHGKPEKQE
ncbi:hypothetical protein Tco_0960909 [Tanacetum coccineum]